MQAIQARVTPDSAASEGKVRSSIKSKRSLSRQDALEADEPPTNCDDDVKININFETQGEALNNSNNNNSNNNNNNNNNNNSTTNRSSSDNSNSFINFDDNSDYTFEDAKDRKSSSSQNHPCVEELPPSLENNETCTPSKLHLYSREGNLEMVRGLLSSGADVNGVYRDGNTRAITPLNLAVRKRRHDVARQLLAAGANVDACEEALSRRESECHCECVCMCVRACVCACVCACVRAKDFFHFSTDVALLRRHYFPATIPSPLNWNVARCKD